MALELASLGEKPYASGEGRGVVDRLFSAGFGAWVIAGWAGREPMGPTDEAGALASGVESPGDEAEVLKPYAAAFALELGEEVLLVGDLVWVATGEGPVTVAAVSGLNGSTARGEGPLVVARVGVVEGWFSGRCPSSPFGKKAGLSLPYKARCWRAINSRRLSSLIAAGLKERSDLFPDISARRPYSNRQPS